MKSSIVTSDTEKLSKTIDWLRFPLMVAVVFVHMNPVVNMQSIQLSQLKSYDLYTFTAAFFSHMLADLAVPCFFLFSGFLYFYKLKTWNKDVYLSKTKKRFQTLIIPYLLWNVLTVAIISLVEFAKFNGGLSNYWSAIQENGIWKIFWNYYEWDLNKTDLLGNVTPKYGPINIPLWFLRDLIVIVLLSPLVYYLIKYTRLIGVLLLGVAFYTKVWFTFPGLNIAGVFFFALGAYFSIHGKNLVTSLLQHKAWWYPLAAITLVLATYFDGTDMSAYVHPLFTIFGVIAVVNLTATFIEHGTLKVNPMLSQASFFIFVTHTILILGYAKRALIYVIPSQDAFYMLLKYFVTPTITVVVCVALYLVTKKVSPRVLSILMGSR